MRIIKKLFYKNDIVFYFLDELRECIPKKYIDIYTQQINYIDKVIWVLNKEVDLFFSKDYPISLNIKEFQETQIAKISIEDIYAKRYKMKIYFVKGHIFSIESNIPFKGLLIDELKEVSIECLLVP